MKLDVSCLRINMIPTAEVVYIAVNAHIVEFVRMLTPRK